MTGTSIVTAWENAESQCYNWLRGILSGTHDADAFLAELPDGFCIDAHRGMWVFSVGGEAGDAPLDYDWNMDTPGGGGTDPIWKLPALFEGVWKDRAVAIQAAGIIRANMPIVEDSLEGVFRFRIRREPAVERAVAKVAPDQETGGEMRVWRLQYPMELWFRKAP